MSRDAPLLRAGHALQLLEGSAQLFPALVQALDAARSQAWIETYIADFSGSAAEVGWALERAARRGVQVRLLVDGVGTRSMDPLWRMRLLAAGVELAVFAPPGRWGLLHPSSWRRLHRKLALIDGALAFCGGINLLDDRHDPNHGALAAPRLDFAVAVRGPLAGQVRRAMAVLWERVRAGQDLRQGHLQGVLTSLRQWRLPALTAHPAAAAGPGQRAALMLRDNLRHRRTIEQAYLRALGRARSEVLIANAYFVPGRKLRRALAAAAARGVRVVLLLQGRYEYFMQWHATRPVVRALLAAGVEVHAYAPSFLHAKVAVVDGRWATVGSSNLDPLSLLLAREANVVVQDAAFAGGLRERLLQVLASDGRPLGPAELACRSALEWLKEQLALGAMRIGLAVHGRGRWW